MNYTFTEYEKAYLISIMRTASCDCITFLIYILQTGVFPKNEVGNFPNWLSFEIVEETIKKLDSANIQRLIPEELFLKIYNTIFSINYLDFQKVPNK